MVGKSLPLSLLMLLSALGPVPPVPPLGNAAAADDVVAAAYGFTVLLGCAGTARFVLLATRSKRGGTMPRSVVVE